MKYKRILCCIFLLVTVLMATAIPASAQEVPDGLQHAAVTLRDGVKNWNNLVTVTFQVDLDTFDGTAESANSLANQVLDLALAHTGAPDEGDYLRFNIGHMEPSSVNFTKQNDSWQFTVTYYFAYWTTAEQEAEVDREIEALVTTLNLKSTATEFDKISTIYEYITGNIVYDYENLANDAYGLKFTTYAAAVNKTAVCQGYSTLFYRLALEAGLDCRIITGTAINADGNPESHSWNLVRLDGQYYYVDPTWDAGSYIYRFFLKSALGMLDHEMDPEYVTEEFQAAYPSAKENYATPQKTTDEACFQYHVTNNKAVIVGYTGTDRDVVVPATLGGYPVSMVAGSAFYYNQDMVSLTFSEGIRYLDSTPILGCHNLKSIHLPSTADFTGSKDPNFLCNIICGPYQCPAVETITVAEGNPYLTVVDGVLYNKEMTILRYYPSGDTREYFEIPEGIISISAQAFACNKYLKEVKMPDTVRMLQFGCFEECTALEKINISNSCRFMSQYCFSYTALESIHIPASLEMLFSGSFGLKSKIKQITVDPDHPYYYTVDNVLYGHYTTENIYRSPYLGDWLIRYPAGREELTFTVPEGIVGIEQETFSDCTNLQEVILPESLQVINSGAFYYCTGLLRIDLPDNLKTIGSQPFWGCSSLVELVIPASVESLGYYLVGQGDNYSLENVVFLGDMPEMSDQTFFNCPVDIYYPAGNGTWERAHQMYAGNEDACWYEACSSHQFETVTMEPLCLAVGYTGQVCSVCGLVKDTGDYVPAIGHDLVIDPIYPPDCEEQIIAFYLCRRCNKPVEYIIEPIGHSYDENGVCINCSPEEPMYQDSELDQELLISISVIATVIFAIMGLFLFLLTRNKKPKTETDDQIGESP